MLQESLVPIEIVFSVSGGIVESVSCSQPAIVTVVDWDAEPLEFDVPGFVSVIGEHGPARAYVSRSGVPSVEDEHPLDAQAIALAEERGIIPRVDQMTVCGAVPTQDLATVLAALRYWQIALEQSGGAITQRFPHFKRADPLASIEVEQLCERLNFGEPDFSPEEFEAWRTTWAPRSGSEET